MAWLRRSRPNRGEQADLERWNALTAIVLQAWVDVALYYLELQPDGRELSRAEAAEARERLVKAAECGRACDQSRDVIERLAEPVFDLRPALRLIQSAARSLLLALSEDPDRRARAMATDDFAPRYRRVHDSWAPMKEIFDAQERNAIR